MFEQEHILVLNCPFDIKFTAKSQRTQRKFIFSLSAERPESEKQQPFGQDFKMLSSHPHIQGIYYFRAALTFMFAVLSAANIKPIFFALFATRMSKANGR